MNSQILKIAERIKDLREFSDFSQKELAISAHIPLEDYMEYEAGTKDIPIGHLYSIASALSIDPTVILTGEDNLSSAPCVVYEGKGMKVDRYEGYSFTSLAHSNSRRRRRTGTRHTQRSGVQLRARRFDKGHRQRQRILSEKGRQHLF